MPRGWYELSDDYFKLEAWAKAHADRRSELVIRGDCDSGIDTVENFRSNRPASGAYRIAKGRSAEEFTITDSGCSYTYFYELDAEDDDYDEDAPKSVKVEFRLLPGYGSGTEDAFGNRVSANSFKSVPREGWATFLFDGCSGDGYYSEFVRYRKCPDICEIAYPKYLLDGKDLSDFIQWLSNHFEYNYLAGNVSICSEDAWFRNRAIALFVREEYQSEIDEAFFLYCMSELLPNEKVRPQNRKNSKKKVKSKSKGFG